MVPSSSRKSARHMRSSSRKIVIEQLELRQMLYGIALGQEIHETMGTVGDRDQYEFSLTQPTRVTLDGLAATQPVLWTLRNNYETLVTNRGLDANSQVLELASGDYSLEFVPQNDATFGYSFRLLDLSSPQLVTSGSPVTGNLTPAGSLNAYRLSASAGDRFTFDSQTVDGKNASWRLLDPVLQLAFEQGLASDVSSFVMPMTGEYLLLIDGSLQDSGDLPYAFQADFVDHVSLPPFTGTTINLGQTVTSSISVTDDQDKYKFTVPANTVLYFDNLDVGTSGSSWTLQGPSGVLVENQPLEGDAYFGYTSQVKAIAGEYQLTINGGSPGSYSFSVVDLAPAPNLVFETVTSATMNPAQKLVAYTIPLDAGESIYLKVQQAVPGNASWTLVDVNGRSVVNQSIFSDIEYQAKTSGAHKLLLEGWITAPDPIDFAFVAHKTQTISAGAIALNTAVNGSIAATGDRNVYSLSLSSDKRIRFDNLAPAPGLNWSLQGTSGPTVSIRPIESGWWDESSTYELPAGDYTLTVDGVADSIGAYSFQLLDLSTAPLLTLDTVQSGTLNPVGETHSYRFNANAGQTIYFDARHTDPGNAYWQILDPQGRSIELTPAYQDIERQFTATGTYTLLISGAYFDTGTSDYSFLLHVPVVLPASPISLGDMVSGSIADVGEKRVYNLTLTSDKLVRFDNLTPASGIYWTLTGSIGNVFAKGLEGETYDQNSTYVLTAGDYVLTLDGIGDAIGPYSFRALDLSTAPTTPLNTVVSASLVPPTSASAYRFSAVAGESLFIDSLRSDVDNTYWQLFDPLGRAIDFQPAYQDMEIQLVVSGDYTLVLTGSYNNTANVEYSFLVHKAVTSPAVSIGLNVPVSGDIAAVGDQRLYSFSLTTDKFVHFDNLDNAPGIFWTLTGPTGTAFARYLEAESTNASATYKLSAGDYVLRLDGIGDSVGPYAFQLLDLEASATLDFDTLTSGILNPAAESHAYRFTGVAGEAIYFDSRSVSGGNSQWQLIDPLGRSVNVTPTYQDMEIRLPMDGTYALLVMGAYSDTVPTDYSFVAHRPVTSLPVAIPFSSVIPGDIAGPGDRQVYSFNLSNPGGIYFDNIPSSPGLVWSLAGSLGTYVSNRPLEFDWTRNGVEPIVRLPAGDYELTVSGSGDATGSYSFRVLDLSSAPAIPLGNPVTDTLDPATRTDGYKLLVSAGDAYTFDSLTDIPGTAYWRLVDPYGRTIFSQPLGNDQTEVRLSLAGEYHLLIEGYFTDTENVSYGFQVSFVDNIPPEPFTGDPLTLGALIDSSLDSTAEVDNYVFNLAADSQLYFDALGGESGILWTLEGPTGVVVLDRNIPSDGIVWFSSSSEILNLVAGDYRLSLRSDGSATGLYQFKLLDVSSGTLIVPGTPVTGTLAPSGTDIYQLPVVAGEQFYFETQTELPQNSPWHLFDPLGRSVASWHLGFDGGAYTLPISGNYFLLVEGNLLDNSPVSYGFNVQPIVDEGDIALTLGQQYSDSLPTVGAFDRYTFNLAAEGQLYFDAISADPGLNWTLTGPTGTIVDQQDFSSDGVGLFSSNSQLYVLTSGSYVLTIRASAGNTGAYAFKLSDVLSVAPFIPDSVVSGTLAATSTEIHRFHATAGEEYYFDSRTGAQYSSWHLFDPLGRSVASWHLGSDGGSNALRLTGEYTLLVESYFFNSVDTQYEFVVHPVTHGSDIPLTLGATQSGELVSVGQVHRYTFELTAASQLYFDALAAVSGINWTLSGPTGNVVNHRDFSDDGVSIFSSSSRLYSLPAGQYVLSVEGYQDTVGQYQFRLSNVLAVSPFTPGTTMGGTLAASSTDIYRFTAQAGQRYYLDSQSPNPHFSSWQLFDALGRSIRSGYMGSDGGTITLVDGGDYSLLIESYFSESNDTEYTFNVQPVLVPIDEPLTVGQVKSGSIETVGAYDRYTFKLNSPSQLYFDALSAASDITWTLSGPMGTIENARSFSNDGIQWYGSDSLIYQAPAGNYVLTVQGNQDAVGAYEFRLVDVLQTPVSIPGTNVSGTLDPASSTTLYRFNAQAGERYFFDARTTAVQNTSWHLFDPQGRSLTSTLFTANMGPVRLPVTGTYTLAIEGYFTDTTALTYEYRVQRVDFQPADTTLTSASIQENQPTASLIGLLLTSDVDESSTRSYSLISGPGSTDNGSFAISGNQLSTTAAFNFEVKPTYSVRVRTTDNLGLELERVFVIQVIDVNEAPADIGLSSRSIPENSVAGVTVGTLTSTDPDTANTFVYALVSGTGSTDNGLFSIAGNELKANSSFNFEDRTSYQVRIRTTDQGGLFFEKAFTIDVTDANEAPTLLAISATSIQENLPANTVVGNFTTTDPDPGDVFAYTLVSGDGATDNGAFTIVGNSLIATSSLNFESKNSYSVRVRTTDSGLLSREEIFVIGVTDVNEVPTAISISSASIPENSAANTTVGTFSTSDPDAGDSFVYSLVAGTGSADNGLFTISGNTLIATSGFDFESRSSYFVRIRTIDSGLLSREEALVITVTNVNEAPTVSVNAPHVSGAVLSTLTNSGTWADPDLTSVTLTASVGTVTRNADGTWSWSYTPTAIADSLLVTITANDGALSAQTTFTLDALAVVAKSGFYYKGSTFANSGVDQATAPDKVLAHAGAAPVALTYQNLINTTLGINGLVFDIAGLAGNALTTSDFTFTMSPQGVFNEATNAPSTWASAPAPSAIVVTASTPTTPGRVRIEWPDNAIANRWLQIRVLPTANTGLRQVETYYIGHLVGELNGAVVAGSFIVTNADLVLVNPIGSVAAIDDRRDVDKNGVVMNADGAEIRKSVIASRSLRRITIPAAGSSQEFRSAQKGSLIRDSLIEQISSRPAAPLVLSNPLTLATTSSNPSTKAETLSPMAVTIATTSKPQSPLTSSSLATDSIAKKPTSPLTASAVDQAFEDLG